MKPLHIVSLLSMIILFSAVGFALEGIAGFKLALGIGTMFAMTWGVIIYGLEQIESVQQSKHK